MSDPHLTGAGATERRQQRAWYFYDWANSAFSTTVVTVFLGPYLPVVLTVRAMFFLILFCGLLFMLRAERWSRGSRTIVVGIALSCVFSS